MKRRRRVRFAGGDRLQSWWLLLAAVLAAVLWAIAQQLGWPVWARAVLAGLAAAVPLIVAALQAWFMQRKTQTRLVDQRAVTGGHGQLPRVRDVELADLGVHRAQVQVPYIERDQQQKLEENVGPGKKAVLVVGHSMSGKTRLAAEVIKRKFPNASLLSAESGKALRELLDEGLDPANIVVWLDHLERFLGPDGLTIKLLNRLTTGRAIVAATIEIWQRETYRPQDKLQPPEWEVLQQFSEIRLEHRLTSPELDRVRATVDDPGVLAAVDRYGLAEYLGAGPEALDKFKTGEIANPVGYALVKAAVDWQRTGLTRPVPQPILATTLSTYLADRPDVPRTNQTIDDGLVWATAKINETVALLGQAFTNSNEPNFEAFDYLIDHLTYSGTPVPDPMWSLALGQAQSAELNGVGVAAYRAAKSAIAETALRRAIASGHAEIAPQAAYNLGILLEEQGDLEGAKIAYQQAIDSGQAEVALLVKLDLGQLLRKQGDLEGAKATLQQVIASGHPYWVPVAAYNLGVLLGKQGDLEGAKIAYQQVIDSGHAEIAPRAAINLGELLKEYGDLAGAKIAYQQVIDSGHAEIVPEAAYYLGGLLEKQGDLEGAKIAYQQAVGSSHAEVAPAASYSLGVLLYEQGDLKGAKAAYQRAINSGHTEITSRAAVNLGLLLNEQGDLKGAKAAYQRAINSGHTEIAPVAAINLGALLGRQGNLEEAKAAYQQAIDSGHAEIAPEAAYYLGELLEKQGDLEGAKAAYQRALASYHPVWALEADVALQFLGLDLRKWWS